MRWMDVPVIGRNGFFRRTRVPVCHSADSGRPERAT
jgi:hypothetical protein